MSYALRECFYSLQGEGARAGTPNVFLRFSGCNLQCVDAPMLGRPMRGNEVDVGFHCDTDWQWTAERLDLAGVVDLVRATDAGRCGWVICTGGEPTLQLDDALVDALHAAGYRLAVETNGTKPIRAGLLDWVSCSPKRGVAAALDRADEVRVVVKDGEEPDDHGIQCRHRFVSPAFWAPPPEAVEGHVGAPSDLVHANLKWCIDWCLKNVAWRLSVQQHKLWGVR